MIGKNTNNKDIRANGSWRQQGKRTITTLLGGLVLFASLIVAPIGSSLGSASAQTPDKQSTQASSGSQNTAKSQTSGAVDKGNSQNGQGITGQLPLDKMLIDAKDNPDSGADLPNSANTSSCGPDWALVEGDNASAGTTGFVGMDGISSSDIWGVGAYYAPVNPDVQYALSEHWNGTSWSVVPVPSVPASRITLLYSVAAVSTNDVWAVGYYEDPTLQKYQTLIERWNGTTWNIVPSPNVTTNHNALRGVVAVSANDVWAFGYYTNNYQRTLTIHWDGATWSVIQSPNIGANSNDLTNGAVVPGSNGADIWAVGKYYDINNAATRTLAMRWSGSTWNIVATPNVGSSDNQFIGTTAVSANEVWAVGSSYVSGTLATLIERWDGTTWSVVASPTMPNNNSVLYDIDASSAGDIWAVGFSYTGAVQTIIEHWNGTSWSMVPANGPGLASALATVLVMSNNDVWASYLYTTNATTNYPFIDHFDGTAWQPVYAPVGPTNVNVLSAVSAAGAGNDVWAVGYYRVVGTGGAPNYNQTLIERWNGATWNVVTSANQSATTNNDLQGIAMVPGTANDGWAVGSYIDPVTYKGRTLIERWNGSTWGTITSPNIGSNHNQLTNVTVVSANNVWAVGNYHDGTAYKTLTEHWNGTSWNVITSPNVAPGTNQNFLSDVAVVPGTSGADVWAVGYTQAATTQTLIMRWDGASNTWNIVASPNGPNDIGFLYGVAALSPTDVWAVGVSNGSGHLTTLTEHWNGGTWSVVSSADFGSTGTSLHDVSALATDDIYAVGLTYVGATSIGPVIEHWNGTSWSLVSSPNPSPTEAFLLGVTAVSSTDIWAVGYTTPPLTDNNQTLIERYHPCPAACTMTFNDVQNGSTFYPYVRCLACQNIVGGYNCGGTDEPCPGMYFRPNNSVTRGQAAKFIANAAGYTDVIPANRQTFADVSSASPFWVYVERVYQHGAINGYACGGPGEPCPGTYFRPGANLTRGQLAKIATTAAGFTDTPSGQTFTDVVPASSFYLYIERAHMHNIISGYACGGAGESCPGTYFRPGLNVTRGQASKIVSGTFFPNCQP